MSGGGTTSSTSGNYPKWLKPSIMGAVQKAEGLYSRAATPPSLYVGMDPNRAAFLGGAAQRDVVDPTLANYGRTMRGEYLAEGSPYQDTVIQRALQDVQGQVGSQFGGAGRYGSGQWASSLADAMTGTAASYRDQNYQAERDRMGQYAQMAPAMLGTGEYTGRAYEEDAALRQEEAYRQFQWPYEKLNQLLGAVYGNPSTQAQKTTSKKDINWVDIVGGILGGPSGGMCWVADELFGEHSEKANDARRWCKLHLTHPFVRIYGRFGRSWAAWLRVHPWAKPIVRPVWELLARLGREGRHAATCHAG